MSDKLNQMATVMAENRKQGEQLKAETTRLTDARTRLDALMAQKRENINERQGELKQVRQAAAELSRSVTDLNELITKLDKTVSEQAGIAEYDRELAAGRGKSRPPRTSPRASHAPRHHCHQPLALHRLRRKHKPADVAQAPYRCT